MTEPTIVGTKASVNYSCRSCNRPVTKPNDAAKFVDCQNDECGNKMKVSLLKQNVEATITLEDNDGSQRKLKLDAEGVKSLVGEKFIVDQNILEEVILDLTLKNIKYNKSTNKLVCHEM